MSTDAARPAWKCKHGRFISSSFFFFFFFFFWPLFHRDGQLHRRDTQVKKEKRTFNDVNSLVFMPKRKYFSIVYAIH